MLITIYTHTIKLTINCHDITVVIKSTSNKANDSISEVIAGVKKDTGMSTEVDNVTYDIDETKPYNSNDIPF